MNLFKEFYSHKKTILFGLTISLIIFLKATFNNDKIVFCNVGQGDAIYIRSQNIDVLIDTGPNSKILECLGKHMPFFDTTIEIAIITHFDKDHYGGFLYLLSRYKVNTLYFNSTNSITEQTFMNKIKKHSTLIRELFAGDKLIISNLYINCLWPYINNFKKEIDKNNSGIMLLIKYEKNKVFLSADVNLQDKISLLQQYDIYRSIFKLPHHGSLNNINYQILKLADPLYAVISVGKNNSYGHPSKKIIDELKALKIETLRTDEIGDIVFELKKEKIEFKK